MKYLVDVFLFLYTIVRSSHVVKIRWEKSAQVGGNYVAHLTVQNKGRKVVQKADFTEPMRITFDNDISRVSVTPTDISMQLSVEAVENSVLVSPFLLNPSENFSLAVYSEFPLSELTVNNCIDQWMLVREK